MKSSDLALEQIYSDEANEIQLQDILTNLPGVIYQFYVTDSNEWGVNYVSDRVDEFFDIPANPTESFFATFLTNVHREDREDFILSIRKAVDDFSSWKFEGRYVKPSGETMWFQGHSTPKRNHDRIVFNGMLLDITERKEAEQAMRESEEKFSKAFYGSPEALNINSMEDGTFIEVNDVFLQKTGYKREEIIGRTASELNFWVDDDSAKRFVEELTTTGKVGNMEARLRMRSGDIRHYLLSSESIELSGRRSSLNYSIDITDLKRAENEKSGLEQQLAQAQKMESIGRLAGGIAHDFNNLLTAISGNTELALMDRDLNQKTRAHLKIVYQTSASAAQLTNQLLAFSRKQIIEPSIIDLNELIANMGRMLSRVIGEDINLYMLPQAGLYNVRADPVQMQQVIMNLAVNARDAMPDGGTLTIETANVFLDGIFHEQYQDIRPGEHVMLSVCDTGIGMTDDIKERLFEPFFTTKELGKGTGLGLATVYGAIKQNHGVINVYSEPGQGTCFKIYLPRAEGEKTSLSVEIEQKKLPEGSETILIIEDDPGVREFTCRVLRILGYHVLETSGGEEALSLSGRFSGIIHLLISDMVMPGMNGRHVAEILVRKRPGMRVLFASGYTHDAIVTQGVLEHNINFLGKPFSGRDLAHRVRHILDSD